MPHTIQCCTTSRRPAFCWKWINGVSYYLDLGCHQSYYYYYYYYTATTIFNYYHHHEKLSHHKNETKAFWT